jgi:hypothetical protein
MRICTLRATGELLEAQALADEGTLIQNAINAGYTAEQVEEREATGAEVAALVAATKLPATDDAVLRLLDNEKALKALALAHSNATIADSAWSTAGYTPAQVRTRFLAAWRAL